MMGIDLYQLLLAPYVEFDFMRRALVGIIALALSGAPVGVFLMLRRMSLTGDAMAHAILPGAALGYLVAGFSLPAMTLGGLAAGVIVATLAGLVARLSVLKEDASLAAFYLISLALGVAIISMRGSAVDLFHVLFGNVLALDNQVLVLLASVATLTLVVMSAIYRPLVMECVDPGFLKSVSSMGSAVHLAFLGLAVLNLVAGFSALGTLLAVGIMMLPAATARLWTADITWLILLAVLFGLVAGYGGLTLSYHLDAGIPSGPAIILAAGAVYIASLFLGRQGGWVWKLLPGQHLKA